MHTNTLITTSFLLTLCVGVKGALSESLNEPHLSTRRDLASLSLKAINYDGGYLTPISIGTPPQELLFLIAPSWVPDNSSTVIPPFWVYSDKCGDACSGRDVFNTSASSSFISTDRETGVFGPKDNIFGTVRAETKARLVNDTVTIAGFTYDNFQFGVSDTFISSTANGRISGVIVLDSYEPATLGALVKPWANPQVGIHLGRATPSHHFNLSATIGNVTSHGSAAAGTITFGGVLSTKYTGDIGWGRTNYVPTMTARNVSVDGSEVTGRGWGQVNYAQEWITYSPADVASIYNRIPGAQVYSNTSYPSNGSFGPVVTTFYQLPCNTTSVVRFKISSPAHLEVPLPPADLISSTIPDQPGMCVGSIVANTHSDEWAFGSAFLKNVYVVYQRSKDGIYGDNPSKFGIAALSAEENLYTDGSPVPSDLSAKAWSGGMRQNRLSTGTIAIVAVTVAAAVLM